MSGGPYTISNLYVNRTTTTGVTPYLYKSRGLFGHINSGATVRPRIVRKPALYAASVTGGPRCMGVGRGERYRNRLRRHLHLQHNHLRPRIRRTEFRGILAGENSGTVEYSHSHPYLTASGQLHLRHQRHP